MRRINFDEPTNDQKWTDWRLRCIQATNNLITDFNNGIKPKFTELYKEMKYYYYINGKSPFWNKCAYCERNIRNQYGDIEHYRPKGRVTDVNNKLIKRIVGLNKEEHPGYYWLAYEFTNLLPSCITCNRPTNIINGAKKKQIGKWDKFPVKDIRAWEVGTEGNEEPLLINPLVDDPSEHFVYDTTKGIIGWKTKEGEMTVKILGLNEHDLPERRVERYELIKTKVAEYIEECKKDPNSHDAQENEKLLRKIKKGYGEFSTFAMCAIKDTIDNYEQAIRRIVALQEN